jgi:hypothetical protein
VNATFVPAAAVRRESSAAVAYRWGVAKLTVTKWRRAPGVGPETAGTTRQRSAAAKPRPDAVFFALQMSQTPVARKKRTATRRGKPTPPAVRVKIATALTGRTATAATRGKLSEIHKRRGTLPPKAKPLWVPWQDEAVRTKPPAEEARLTGRTVQAVYHRRWWLGLTTTRTR